jgi:hypothetical protein
MAFAPRLAWAKLASYVAGSSRGSELQFIRTSCTEEVYATQQIARLLMPGSLERLDGPAFELDASLKLISSSRQADILFDESIQIGHWDGRELRLKDGIVQCHSSSPTQSFADKPPREGERIDDKNIPKTEVSRWLRDTQMEAALKNKINAVIAGFGAGLEPGSTNAKMGLKHAMYQCDIGIKPQRPVLRISKHNKNTVLIEVNYIWLPRPILKESYKKAFDSFKERNNFRGGDSFLSNADQFSVALELVQIFYSLIPDERSITKIHRLHKEIFLHEKNIDKYMSNLCADFALSGVQAFNNFSHYVHNKNQDALAIDWPTKDQPGRPR